MSHVLTADRLHRLSPSDIPVIRKELRSEKGRQDIVETLLGYLEPIEAPSNADLDDVGRITLQLKTIGLWDRVRADAFLAAFQTLLDPRVVREMANALHIKVTSLPRANVDEAVDAVAQKRAPSSSARTVQEIITLAAQPLSRIRAKSPARRLMEDFPGYRVSLKKMSGFNLEGTVKSFDQRRRIAKVRTNKGTVSVSGLGLEQAGLQELGRGQTVWIGPKVKLFKLKGISEEHQRGEERTRASEKERKKGSRPAPRQK